MSLLRNEFPSLPSGTFFCFFFLLLPSGKDEFLSHQQLLCSALPLGP